MTQTRLSWTALDAPGPMRAITIGVTPVGLALVAFGNEPAVVAQAAQRLGLDPVRDGDGVNEAAAQVAAYLQGRLRDVTVPLDWRLTAGTQRTVLQALHSQVGYGRTVGYAELAGLSGAYAGHGYTAARGVGAIMGSNPIPVVVPCHRVVASDGLGGFGGGRATKEWLLALEGVLPPTLDLF